MPYQQQNIFDSSEKKRDKNSAVSRFPNLEPGKEDKNPAIQLFGRRFYKGQTEIEYLVEFMLLFVSPKRIKTDNDNQEIGEAFPDISVLKNWPDDIPLEYKPRMHLSLKLFAFLAASSSEGRHPSHQEKFREICKALKRKMRADPSLGKEQVLGLLEQVFLGFVGIAGERGWCTHSFLPIARELIAGETIWGKKRVKPESIQSWEDAFSERMFTFSNHDFLARGGELLFLQLCNLFSMADSPKLRKLEKKLQHPEKTAIGLQKRIETGLKQVLDTSPGPELDMLARWIEARDPETQEKVEVKKRWARCGWCPAESWPEAYLFAYELSNILEALLDPMEKIEMLKLCCVFQTLRSLCAQAARYWPRLDKQLGELGGINGYAWIITDPDTQNRELKTTARRNLTRIQEMIHGAIRTREIQQLKKEPEPSYKEGDEHSYELLNMLAKKIEFIVPYTGPAARFVMNEHLLRYLMLALIPPGCRFTLQSFQERLYQHYGAAIDGFFLKQAVQWTYGGEKNRVPSFRAEWLEEKLRSTGFLIPLSDSVSLVHNPFSG